MMSCPPTTWYCPACRQPTTTEGWTVHTPSGDPWASVCSLLCLIATSQDELVHQTRVEEQERIARMLPKRFRSRITEETP